MQRNQPKKAQIVATRYLGIAQTFYRALRGAWTLTGAILMLGLGLFGCDNRTWCERYGPPGSTMHCELDDYQPPSRYGSPTRQHCECR